jgi:VWFA-related protein
MLSRLAVTTLSSLLILTPARPEQPDTTIRSSSRLVEVSVVVLDNHGNPITGLAKDDFSVSDEGHAQSISIFTAETPAAAAPLATPLPANTFTNRFELKGQDPGAVTIILFDALNTAFADQSLARKQILKFLKTLAPQDHVAIYALTNTKLYILHDFTSDSAALVSAVNHFTPDQTIAFEASNPGFMDLVGMTGNPDWGSGHNLHSFQSTLNNANGVIADVATFNRVNTTNEALGAISAHVESIPGRKSLVWISGGFPLQIELGRIGNIERSTYSYEDIVGTSLALNRANISIYPIDVHGIELDAGVDPAMRGPGNAHGTNTSFFARQNRLDSFRLLADRTGGVAFYGSNDVNDGIRRAFDDGRYAYTIGFYPDHNKWDGKFREIKIKVKTGGAQLRYRKGYYAVPERTAPQDIVEADLQQAAASPLNSTSLGIVVVATPVPHPAGSPTAANPGAIDPSSGGVLELRVTLDPKQFLLTPSSDRRKGALDLMFLQNSLTGATLSAEKQHLEVNFEDKQFAYLSTAGMILLRHLTVSRETSEIRIIVRDANSGALGSVAVPASALHPSTSAPGTSKPS